MKRSLIERQVFFQQHQAMRKTCMKGKLSYFNTEKFFKEANDLDKSIFMYRIPILCTLHVAVDFLKFLKIAVVWGGI